MDAIKAIKTRKSIRAYKPDKIKKEILEEIVDCGRLAATAMNVQPWEFVVITDSEKLIKISELMNHSQFVGKSSAGIFIISKNTEYYLEDISAATENILIACNAHKLGACWIAGDKQSFAEPIKNFIGVPKDYKLVSIVSLGVADENPPAKEKRPLSEVIHWEKY